MDPGQANLMDLYLEVMKHEDCKNVLLEYKAEQKRIADELASQESVFYQKLDDVAPENILQTILDKYKGKVVGHEAVEAGIEGQERPVCLHHLALIAAENLAGDD